MGVMGFPQKRLSEEEEKLIRGWQGKVKHCALGAFTPEEEKTGRVGGKRGKVLRRAARERQLKETVELWEQGMAAKEISVKTGRPLSSIHQDITSLKHLGRIE